MRSVYSLLLAALATLSANISEAQNSILMGKITNGHDKPVVGAVVRLSKPGSVAVETTSDKDGLYCTQQVQADKYNVTIVVGGKAMKANSVTLLPMDKDKKYYNFTLSGGKLSMDETATDPYVAVLSAHSELDTKSMSDRMNKPAKTAPEAGTTKMPATEHFVIKHKSTDQTGVMLMGKITNSNGKPVEGAIVRVSKAGMKTVETASQKDGLYYSDMLQPDTYNVTITVNGATMKVKSINLPAMDNEKKYYNFKMKGAKVETEETTEDPFIGTVSGKLEATNTDASMGGGAYQSKKAK